MKCFTERLRDRVQSLESAVCVGLDPRAKWIPSEIKDQAGGDSPREHLARTYEQFCRNVIDLVEPHAVAVKPQAAFFEALLTDGFAALESVCRYARERGLLVVLDVKRGDIGTTAEAYAKAYLAPVAGDEPLADAITINAYMGFDGVRPFLEQAVMHKGGAFVLVKTSNPSSSEFQDQNLEGGGRVYERVAEELEGWNKPHDVHGFGPLGAVVGATWPEQLADLRGQLKSSWILIPGFGAQGGGPESVVGGFNTDGQGGLVTASRSVVFPWAKEPTIPQDWRERIATEAKTMKESITSVLSARRDAHQ